MAGKSGARNKPGKHPRGRGRRGENTTAGDKEILCGYHCVFEALKAGRRKFESVMVHENRSDKRVQAVVDLAEKKTGACAGHRRG